MTKIISVRLACLWLCTFLLTGVGLFAQDIPIDQQKFTWFPYPLNAKSRTSIGITSTTMPNEITEEVHFRVPAGDLHVMKKLSGKLDLDARLIFQVFQNMLTIGPRWSTALSDRISMSIGDDLGVWFGVVKIQNIDTKGYGFQNYPHISFGYRFNKQILLTLRADQVMSFGVKTKAGNTDVASNYRLFSGSAYTVVVEQPFSGKTSMTLGFRAIYTDYYWQTWTLFENYKRNLLFPQFIVGLIL
jgi:hypothetical protein